MTTKTLIKEPAAKSIIVYSVSDEIISEMSAKYMPLTVCGVDDTEGFTAVSEALLECRDARIAVEETRKEMKEESLRYGQKVDAEAKRLKLLIEPIEAHLTHEKETVKREIARLAKEKEDEVFAARHAMIVEAGGETPERLLRLMKEDEFLTELASVKIATLNRIEREAAEALEKKRLLDEAEALRVERAELARLRKEQEDLLAAERKKQDEDAAAQRAEQRRIAREQDEEFARIRREQEAEIVVERALREEQAAAQRAEQDRLIQELADEMARLRLLDAAEPARQEVAACVETVAAAYSIPELVVYQEVPPEDNSLIEGSWAPVGEGWIISRSAAVDAIRRLVEIGDVAIGDDMRPYCRCSGEILGDDDDESNV